ncbi:MAG TPA: type II toxin-antitoxin system RelE/ParE family toxin [Chthoniobacteraceae bacterium]|jgi:mRNA-degrading endonuclease RelE of RelBE toxin-antitoxin system|nr:type II toxin-antitoxin system RelE/ParE family toxin [Chthoniobacteraceae bacterium]
MTFYETDIFTEQIVEAIDDDSYRELQDVLIHDPESGDLIPRTRGLRKIRWRVAGRGKRGGIRVIYYLVTRSEIFMLYAYAKNEQENLTQEQLQRLRKLVDQHLANEEL